MSKEPITYYAHCANCRGLTKHNQASGKCLVGGCGVIDPAKLDQHQVHTEDTQTDSDEETIEQMLLRVRSDQYGDSGNYNDAKLTAAIEAREREARIDEVRNLPLKEGGVDMVHGTWQIYGFDEQERDARLQQLQPNPQAGDGGEGV